MIDARIVADSIAPSGSRLTTFVCVYHRFIHSEVMTHRVFSRNAASSRAIPVHKMLKRIESDPAVPIYWGQNQPGMQASGEISSELIESARREWLAASKDALLRANNLMKLGVHKQVANRVLEPYMWMTTIISATEWENFFSLRVDSAAQPEFFVLARKMLCEYVRSKPKQLDAGQWHLPFADKYVSSDLPIESLLKITTARCARVSYLNFEGDIDHQKDFELHDRLLGSGHMSPFEHAARAEFMPVTSGNFVGYTQYRKQFPNEYRKLSLIELEQLLEKS